MADATTTPTIWKILDNPNTWAVFVILACLYGAYRLGVVFIPQWIATQKEIAEKLNSGKKERAEMYISSNEKLYNLLHEGLLGVKCEVGDLKKEVHELNWNCHQKIMNQYPPEGGKKTEKIGGEK